MNLYRADLHIHTILSPCGDLQMSPANIIAEANSKGLDIIGITDHNSTRQAALVKEMGEKKGLYVLCGAEVTSKEEVHCLTFFPDLAALNEFQIYLDENLPDIKNDTQYFWYQVCVDKNEDIIFEEPRLLISAINQTIEQIEARVHALNGIFIPAHINRPSNSLLSQLGFVHPGLKVDALEISKQITKAKFIDMNPNLEKYTFIQSSDAHLVPDIGTAYTGFLLQNKSFDEIRMALGGKNGRLCSNMSW